MSAKRKPYVTQAAKKQRVMKVLMDGQKDGKIQIKKKELAERAGLTIDQTRHALRGLEEDGYLIANKKTSKDAGVSLANEFVLTEKAYNDFKG